MHAPAPPRTFWRRQVEAERAKLGEEAAAAQKEAAAARERLRGVETAIAEAKVGLVRGEGR